MKVLILCALVVAASAMKKLKLNVDCQQELTNSLNKNLLGAFKPRCEQVGSEWQYERVQCHGSLCFCVSKIGEKIGDFQDHIVNSQDMDCNCARDQFEFQQTGMVGLSFNCDSNGNYGAIQCMGTVCSCADNEGNFLSNSKTVNIWEQDKLNC